MDWEGKVFIGVVSKWDERLMEVVLGDSHHRSIFEKELSDGENIFVEKIWEMTLFIFQKSLTQTSTTPKKDGIFVSSAMSSEKLH